MSRRKLYLERLESRRVLAAPACIAPDCQSITLSVEDDKFGRQIPVVQAYQDETANRATVGIYDTGASVVSFSAVDQVLLELLESPIPIKNPGGAQATAVGGTIVGDVSVPGEILVDGLHAVDFSTDLLSNPDFVTSIDFSNASEAEGVQAFIGTEEGSPALPSLAGTPIHNPSTRHPEGVAASIDMAGFAFDLGEFLPELPELNGVVVDLPDLRFVDPGSDLSIPAELDVSDVVRIPLSLLGTSNHLAPGDDVTSSPVPVQTGVDVYDGDLEIVDQTMLFDTGAQVTVISELAAGTLGLDLEEPEFTIEVIGAGGTATVPGFALDALDVPVDGDGDGEEDGILRFVDVPVYVLDVAPGIDGILGTNLLNDAAQLLYDPWGSAGPSLQLTFLTDGGAPMDPQAQAGLNVLAAAYPAFANVISGQLAPGFHTQVGPAWQNPVDRLDVDGDGVIAPRDVLRLFNLLDQQGAQVLPDPPIRSSTTPVFFDVNGDGLATPTDPLLIINYINALGSVPGAAEGEGEGLADQATGSLINPSLPTAGIVHPTFEKRTAASLVDDAKSGSDEHASATAVRRVGRFDIEMLDAGSSALPRQRVVVTSAQSEDENSPGDDVVERGDDKEACPYGPISATDWAFHEFGS